MQHGEGCFMFGLPGPEAPGDLGEPKTLPPGEATLLGMVLSCKLGTGALPLFLLCCSLLSGPPF